MFSGSGAWWASSTAEVCLVDVVCRLRAAGVQRGEVVT
jgi:hypothetical protein